MLNKIFELLLVLVSLVVFCVFVVVFALDYAGGCGESFEYANGSVHQGECIGREYFNLYLGRLFK